MSIDAPIELFKGIYPIRREKIGEDIIESLDELISVQRAQLKRALGYTGYGAFNLPKDLEESIPSESSNKVFITSLIQYKVHVLNEEFEEVYGEGDDLTITKVFTLINKEDTLKEIRDYYCTFKLKNADKLLLPEYKRSKYITLEELDIIVQTYPHY